MATLTKSTGTVTLSGTAEKVTLPAAYGWVWLKNMSDADMFAGLSADISEGADGVMVIPAGECGRIQTDGFDFVYLMGTGNALVVAQNYADCPFKVGAKGGEIPDLSEYAKKTDIRNENLLINPDFKINQRGDTVFSVDYHAGGKPIPQSQKYTVDRWRIMDGEANISNGKFTLTGTIIQVLENSIGSDFAATVSVESGTATASYNDSTKTFSIVGNNAVLNWAKLERGSNATQFIPPDPATELMKCMRYYEKIVCSSNMYTIACQFFNNLTDCVFSIPMMPKRVAYPTSTIDYSAMNYQNSENIVNVSNAFANEYTVNSVSIVAKLSSPTTVCTHGWVVDFTIEIEAEIY